MLILTDIQLQLYNKQNLNPKIDPIPKMMKCTPQSPPKSQTCTVCLHNFNQFPNSILKPQVIRCEGCQLLAHKYCYLPKTRRKVLLCDGCEARKKNNSNGRKKIKIRCCVCMGSQGLMKRIVNQQDEFGHVLCLLLSPLHLVTSYYQLTFASIASHTDPANSPSSLQQFICRICQKLGDRRNSCQCSARNCAETVHWRCMMVSEQVMDEDFWVSSLRRIGSRGRFEMEEFYAKIQLYLNEYFQENIFEEDETHQKALNSSLNDQTTNIMCPKHSKQAYAQCKCQKQYQSGFIFCDHCQAFNHLRCQNLDTMPQLQTYKCLQCKQWQLVVRKKKRPFLPTYPNMNIYDYIYLQVYYEEGKYRMERREERLLTRLPFMPSLEMYEIFLDRYASKQIGVQLSLDQLREFVEAGVEVEEGDGELVRAIKMVRILITPLGGLEGLKQEFQETEWNKLDTKAEALRLLKEFNRKYLKGRGNQCAKQTHQIKVQQQQDYQSFQQQTFQPTESIQFVNPLLRLTQQKQQYFQPFQDSQGTHTKTITVSDFGLNVIKESFNDMTHKELLERMSLKWLEKDLYGEAFEIGLGTRERILGALEPLSEGAKAMISVITVQKAIASLMNGLNKLSSPQAIQISLISDLRGYKMTQQNLPQFFKFFQSCKGTSLKPYSLLCLYLKPIAEQMISSNTRRCIKTMQQMNAYETILETYDIPNVEWLRVLVGKKGYIDGYLEKVEYVLANGEIVSQLGLEMYGNQNENKEKSYNLKESCLIVQVLLSCLAYCRENQIQYYLPTIQSYLLWYRIYRQCIDKIPLQFLLVQLPLNSPSSTNPTKLYKLNGQHLVEIDRLMKQTKFPVNTISNAVAWYADKYRNICEGLFRFLRQFQQNLNLKGESTRTEKQKQKAIRFDKQQILGWLVQARISGFQCQTLIAQVSEILFLYQQLALQIRTATVTEIVDQPRLAQLKLKLSIIPLNEPIHQ